MTGEGDPSRGKHVERESAGSRNKGGGTSLVGRLREASRDWFTREKPQSLKPDEDGTFAKYRFLDRVQKANTFEDAIEALRALRLTQEYVFPIEGSIGSDGPQPIKVVDMMIVLKSLRSGRPVSKVDIPIPIRALCERLLSTQQAQEHKVSYEHTVCIDQDGHQIRIPKKVADKFGLKDGEKIIYDNSYDNSSVLSPERRATDHQAITRAVQFESKYWINPNPVGDDKGHKIVICVGSEEYTAIYLKYVPQQ